VTVDAAEGGWRGKVGVVPKLVPSAAFEAASAVAYVCGPEIMMRFAVRALVERGVAPERIHVSLERNMRCGVGHCGHCQLGPTLICRDGPVYAYADAAPWLEVREL
jgi:NAD(P)H-flavin reductase